MCFWFCPSPVSVPVLKNYYFKTPRSFSLRLLDSIYFFIVLEEKLISHYSERRGHIFQTINSCKLQIPYLEFDNSFILLLSKLGEDFKH